MPGTPGEEAAFAKGEIAGQISARLAAHDRHFANINGSIERLANEVHQLNMNLQRQSDVASANETKVIATAKALKEAEEARRTNTEASWSPYSKLMALVGAIIAVLTLALGIYIAFRGGG